MSDYLTNDCLTTSYYIEAYNEHEPLKIKQDKLTTANHSRFRSSIIQLYVLIDQVLISNKNQHNNNIQKVVSIKSCYDKP